MVCCDPAATAAGVAVGQKLSTALGLAPGVAVFEQDATSAVRVLEQLACWAGAFTPQVCLMPPAALLLEIGGCLRLFGGLERLLDAVGQSCLTQGYARQWAVAPTPLGARWLAVGTPGRICLKSDDMHRALAALPCAVAGWPATVLERLDSYGVKCLGDLLSLPSAGLRRRLGAECADTLARAWGTLPDMPPTFVFPETFSQALVLPGRVEHAEGVLFVGQRLFSALAGWLNGRQLLVRQCCLRLRHDGEPDTDVVLRFAEPAADEGRFVRLLREHLSRRALCAPVEAVELTADDVVARAGESLGLFERITEGEGVAACLERLQARLGEQTVQRLGEVADHRPECATRPLSVRATLPVRGAGTEAYSGGHRRPLWLLAAPQALLERAGVPQWHGALRLMSQPERVESGWWDADEVVPGDAGDTAVGDIRRDYFVACNPQGQWAWVFRDAGGWYLHGLFA